MGLFLLDEAFVPKELIDDYQSLIWTDRFQAWGDFKLVVPSTPAARRYYIPNQALYYKEADSAMLIENVTDRVDVDGGKFLDISGRSLTAMLDSRTTHGVAAQTGAIPEVVKYTNMLVKDIMTKMFVDRVGPDANVVADRIPYVNGTVGTSVPQDIPWPTDRITLEVKPSSVYEFMKDIAEAYTVGFSLSPFDIFNGRNKTQKMTMRALTGADRSTYQSLLPPVEFSPQMDNVDRTSFLKSIENWKNVAYVYAPNGTSVVYAPSTSAATVGFDRRVLMVDASSTNLSAGAALTAELQRIGKEALAKHNSLYALDGEIVMASQYKYRADYNIGDVVSLRNEDGVTNKMRVMEVILTDDSEGLRVFPTLTLDTFLTPGTWFAWDYNGVWETATQTWGELPT